MTTSDHSPSYNVFVYGSFQEPSVVSLILECTPVIVSAQLHGFHLYRLKGRLHPCIAPSESGLVNGKIFIQTKQFQKMTMTSSDQSPSHNVFVYGSFQEPSVVNLILECNPDTVSAQLHGYHLYRLKGRLHPCISPSENGLINGKILTGLTDGQLENLDMVEGDEYVRKTVEVVLTDTSEKMNVETYVWANKDDPNMYGEWDFEEWKRLHMEKFIEASKKFMEWKKNPDGKTREEFEKFVYEDPAAPEEI